MVQSYAVGSLAKLVKHFRYSQLSDINLLEKFHLDEAGDFVGDHVPFLGELSSDLDRFLEDLAVFIEETVLVSLPIDGFRTVVEDEGKL